MMKQYIVRILSAAFVLVFALTALSACGQQSDGPADASEHAKDTATSIQDADVSAPDSDSDAPVDNGDIPMVKTWTEGDVEFRSYFHKDEYGSDCAIVMTNTGKKDIGFSITASGKDASGAQIDEGYVNVDVLGAGKKSLRFLSFYTEDTLYDIDYTVEFREGEMLYKDAVDDLAFDYHDTDNVLTVDITNTGSAAARSVMAYALFFDASGAVVYEASASVGDTDGEIKPGDTQSCDLYFNTEYDHYEVYLSGNYYLL